MGEWVNEREKNFFFLCFVYFCLLLCLLHLVLSLILITDQEGQSNCWGKGSLLLPPSCIVITSIISLKDILNKNLGTTFRLCYKYLHCSLLLFDKLLTQVFGVKKKIKLCRGCVTQLYLQKYAWTCSRW